MTDRDEVARNPDEEPDAETEQWFDASSCRPDQPKPDNAPTPLNAAELSTVGAFSSVKLVGQSDRWRDYEGRQQDGQLVRIAVSKTASHREAMCDSGSLWEKNTSLNVHDVGQLPDGRWFVVSRSPAGIRLAEASPTCMEAVQITLALAEQLTRMHSQGFVHGSLGADCVYQTNSLDVMAVDWGMQFVPDFIRRRNPAYTCPEVLAGSVSTPDCRGDIWSVGVILYQMLVGRPPFLGDDSDVKEAVVHGHARPPRQIDDAIPQVVEAICLRCLSTNPSARYATAAELVADLKAAAREMTVGQTSQLQTRFLVTAGMLLLFIAAIVSFVILWQPAAATTTRIVFTKDSLAASRVDNTSSPAGLQAELAIGDQRIRQIAVSADGAQMAVVHGDGVQIWDVHRWTLRGNLTTPGDSFTPTAAAFASNRTWLAWGGNGNRLYVWDVKLGEEVCSLVWSAGESDTVQAIAFSSNAGMLACVGSSHWEIFDLTMDPPQRKFSKSLAGRGYGIAFSPAGRSVAVGSYHNPPLAGDLVEIWRLADGAKEMALVYGNQPGAIAPTQAGGVVAWPDSISRVATTAYAPTDGTNNSQGPSSSVVSWRALSRVACSLAPGDVFAISLTSTPLVASALGTTDRMFSKIAANSQRGDVHLMKGSNPRIFAQFNSGHQGEVVALALFADGSRMATGGSRGRVRIWNVDDLLSNHQNSTPYYSEDMTRAVTGLRDVQ